jgi:RimJ/RimL family protein N-acetyltransferase
LHGAGLEADEARHNLILGLLGGAARSASPALRTWSFSPSGACALQSPGWPIVLGKLDARQCQALAETVRDLDFAGVVGPDQTAAWFADAGRRFGIAFAEPIPQGIHAIRNAPRYPGAPGAARPVTPDDAPLLLDWLTGFWREATPHDPQPSRERADQAAASGDYLLWMAEGEPVSLGGIVRRTRHGAAIAAIYTPPALRGRGFAGSVTAALVERVYAEGRDFACLYTDLRNPASNRCYAKVGFAPVCGSILIPCRQDSRA